MIRPRLLDEYPTADAGLLGRGAAMIDPTGPVPRLVVRTDEALVVHDLAPGGRLEPVAAFPGPVRGRRITGLGPVAPDLSHAVLVEEDSDRVVTADGTVLWELDQAGPPGVNVRYVRWVQPAGAEPRVWLAVPPDPAADGRADPHDTIHLALFGVGGDELDRLAIPLAGRQRSVGLAFGPDARPLAAGVRVSGRAATFRVAPGGTVAHVADRELLDADPLGSGFVTIGRGDGGDTDARWHDAEGAGSATVITCAGLLASEGDGEPVHVAPYLSGRGGGYLDDGLLLLGMEDDYDEAETEVFGAERWRESSHWLVSSGRPLGMVDYPADSDPDDLSLAVPLGDGTWLTRGRDALHRWGVDR